MRRWAFRLAVLLILAAAGLLVAKQRIATPGPAAALTTVVVPKGTPTPEIGRLLKQAGVIDQPWLFVLATRLGERRPLIAGEYAVPTAASIADIVALMRKGTVVIHKLTIAEGLTVQQVATLVNQADALTGTVAVPIEGSLLPETYYYTYGEDRAAVVGRMTKAMTQAVDALWATHQPDSLPSGKAELVTLASIVERETGIPEERPHVAAVFLNRLRLHMKLQSDPTVIYALSHGAGFLDHPLSHADLAADSPYNTYLAAGLPPGPICNPGKASLAAVMHPAISDDLYFVADGTGGHVFAASLAEHNKNVTRLRALEQAARGAATNQTH